MYKRILLAYDGTAQGMFALREGALLAKTCGAKVCLLAVVPQTPGMLMAEGAYCGAVGHQVDPYRQLLQEAVARLNRLGIEPVSELAAGEPSAKIAAAANEFGADLVIVGHKAEGLFARWWSGSTRAYLSDHVHCSLLIARNSLDDDALEAACRNAAAKS